MKELENIVQEALTAMAMANMVKVEITTEAINLHRKAEARLYAFGKEDIYVRPSYCYGRIAVGMWIDVPTCPEEILDYVIMNDDPAIGSPHHYELNEEHTEILYVRHGTTGYNTETSRRIVERRKEMVKIWIPIKEDFIENLPKMGIYEPLTKTIKIVINALKALTY